MRINKKYIIIAICGIWGFFSVESHAQKMFLPTNLKVTVFNNLGNVVLGCEVTLYLSEQDYKTETNSVIAQLTDKKGRTIFKKMKPKAYYVHAQMGDKNNIGSGVLTNTLEEGRTNVVNTIID